MLIEVRLDRAGRILEPLRIVKSVSALNQAALAALRAWRFSPAHDERGEPIAAVVEVPLRFVLR